MTTSPLRTLRPNEATRRRVALLRWSMLAWCAVAALVGTLSFHGLTTIHNGEVIVYTLQAALVGCALSILCFDRLTHAPAAHGGVSALLATGFGFGAVMLGFAGLHAHYSRLTLLAAALCWAVLLYAIFRHCIRRHVLRLCVLQPQAMQLLQSAALERGPRRLGPLIHLDTAQDAFSPLMSDGVVIDRYASKNDALRHQLTQLKLANVRIYSADHVYELLSGRVSLAHVEDSFLDDRSALVWYGVFKRLSDIVGAALLLIITAPLILAAAVAVRLDSPGPAWFTQQRHGRGGRVFRMYKFRSMRTAAPNAPMLLTQPDDPRVTRVGAWLRRWRIDELPQLVNVLAGHMSLIGPRPEWTESAQHFLHTIPHYPYRHLVRPGITGWAQVRQGHVIGLDESAIKLEYDLYYVKHLSLALDTLIVAETLRIVWSGFGAK